MQCECYFPCSACNSQYSYKRSSHYSKPDIIIQYDVRGGYVDYFSLYFFIHLNYAGIYYWFDLHVYSGDFLESARSACECHVGIQEYEFLDHLILRLGGFRCIALRQSVHSHQAMIIPCNCNNKLHSFCSFIAQYKSLTRLLCWRLLWWQRSVELVSTYILIC